MTSVRSPTCMFPAKATKQRRIYRLCFLFFLIFPVAHAKHPLSLWNSHYFPAVISQLLWLVRYVFFLFRFSINHQHTLYLSDFVVVLTAGTRLTSERADWQTYKGKQFGKENNLFGRKLTFKKAQTVHNFNLLFKQKNSFSAVTVNSKR